MFLFFACIAPAIAFGALFDTGTDGQLGAFEMILSSAFSGIVYAFFSGQPLCIMGATGPELAYTLVFYNICKSLDLEFMVARLWCGLWCAFMTITLAITDSNYVMSYVTQFTEDVFSALISLIFIIEAILNIHKEFDEVPLDAAFLTVILAFGSFGLAMYFRAFRSTKWLNPMFRNIFANFGVTISVILFTGISLAWNDVEVTTLSMPDKFEPTMKMPDGKVRPWIINPFGMDTDTYGDFPVWAIFFCFLPAIGLCILGFLDQNLTSLLINRKANALRKPPAYHLDLLTCGVFIYPVCSFLGLPFTHAATIRSLTHLISLTEFDTKTLEDGSTKKFPVRVNEQRVTQLGIHVLIFCSAFASSILKKLPVAVLYGIFLYMGVSTIAGNDLFDRMQLWMIWVPDARPKYECMKKIPNTSRIHKFTFIQFMCLVILYALKSIKEIAVVFPFFLVVIALVRIVLGKYKFFSDEELKALDVCSADPGEGEDDVVVSGAKEQPEPEVPADKTEKENVLVEDNLADAAKGEDLTDI